MCWRACSALLLALDVLHLHLLVQVVHLDCRYYCLLLSHDAMCVAADSSCRRKVYDRPIRDGTPAASHQIQTHHITGGQSKLSAPPSDVQAR